MKKILVATDFSEGADVAIRQASDRGGKKDRLIVCHAIPLLPPTDPALIWANVGRVRSSPGLRKKLLEELRKRVETITGRKVGSYEVLLGDGNPAVFVVSTAEKLGVDLIVVGSHGSTGLTRFLVGSVADRVMRHAHCPVLVARPVSGPGKILVATDFSDPSLPAVNAGAQESRRTGTPLAILHSIEVVSPLTVYSSLGIYAASAQETQVQEELRREVHRKLEKALRSAKIRGTKWIEYGNAAAAILRTAERVKAQMIVVGSIGKTGLSRLFLGSTSERVAQAAGCPVLIVRLHR